MHLGLRFAARIVGPVTAKSCTPWKGVHTLLFGFTPTIPTEGARSIAYVRTSMTCGDEERFGESVTAPWLFDGGSS